MNTPNSSNPAAASTAEFRIPQNIHTLDIIESALDYNSARYSTWSMYRILTGESHYNPRTESAIQKDLHEALIRHFEKTYKAKLGTIRVDILPHLPPMDILVFKESGTLAKTHPPGTALVIETPQKNMFDALWMRFQSFDVPFTVRIKCAMINRALNTKSCLVWVVTDMGENSEFQKVDAQPDLADRIQRKTHNLIERVRTENAPEPGDEDVEQAFINEVDERRKTGQDPVIRTIEPGSPEYALIESYISNNSFYRESAKASKTAEKQSRESKNALLTLFNKTDELRLPDGRSIVLNIKKRQPGYQNGSTWIELNVNDQTED